MGGHLALILDELKMLRVAEDHLMQGVSVRLKRVRR
jgi:hypothetical protein